jgi:hypothetical protein
MDFQNTAHEHGRDQTHGFHLNDNVCGAIVVVIGAAGLVGLAFGAMTMLTSPDGWVMKAANQAMTTAQQGTLASYDIASDQ